MLTNMTWLGHPHCRIRGVKHSLCGCTSKIHLVSWCPVSLLFALITGNCDVLECAPVLLVALQRQFFGSARQHQKRWRVKLQMEGEYQSEKRHPNYHQSYPRGHVPVDKT